MRAESGHRPRPTPDLEQPPAATFRGWAGEISAVSADWLWGEEG